MEKNEKNKLPGSSTSQIETPNGESMKDSMTESPANNDNAAIPTAEEITDENGKLNAEKFKKSYQGKENSEAADEDGSSDNPDRK